MTTQNSVARFTDRVELYLKYRPHYPAGIVPFLVERTGLSSRWHVVDVGSGTGFLSECFLNFGCTVTGIEPNAEMRAAGESRLNKTGRFTSIDGKAETTGLPSACAELVSAGTAFHWFDPTATRAEFSRILKPAGWVLLVWNTRPMTPGTF